MRPELWQPPIELSPTEQSIVKRIKRAKLFTFLRECRHELFDQSFQQVSKLYATQYADILTLALVTILQAYTGASDAEAIEALTMDRRWQLVVNCLDCEQPFLSSNVSQVSDGIDDPRSWPTVEKTVELANKTKVLVPGSYVPHLIPAPVGASKEDTYNLLGHALRKAISDSTSAGEGWLEVADEMSASILATSSLKAAWTWIGMNQMKEALVWY